MINKILVALLLFAITACGGPFKGVEGVKENGKVVGGSPSRKLRNDKERTEKRQRRAYKKEMKKRAKRLGTTKKK